MIILRDVVQYVANGQNLVAEVKLTKEEFDKLRTFTLIDPAREFELESVVYWWNGGYPPKPVYMDCPVAWRGRVVNKEQAIYQVNVKNTLKWWLKYKPPTDTGGGAI